MPPCGSARFRFRIPPHPTPTLSVSPVHTFSAMVEKWAGNGQAVQSRLCPRRGADSRGDPAEGARLMTQDRSTNEDQISTQHFTDEKTKAQGGEGTLQHRTQGKQGRVSDQGLWACTGQGVLTASRRQGSFLPVFKMCCFPPPLTPGRSSHITEGICTRHGGAMSKLDRKFYPLEPVNVTLFGSRVFADVIKLNCDL